MKPSLYLPDGVEDLLQPEAWQFEELRRKILDLFVSWGFQYVDPPVVEYLDSLLVASGADLDLQTLKVLDQVSGRQLGIRADLTSQVNFQSLLNILDKNEIKDRSFHTQREFLFLNGINLRAEQLIKANKKKEELILDQVSRLTDIDKMGNLFKFLIFSI